MQLGRSLALLEAAYRLDGTDGDWVRGLAEQMDDLRGADGIGTGAFAVRGQVDGNGQTTVAAATLRHVVASDQRSRAHILDTIDTYSSLPFELQGDVFFSALTASTGSEVTHLGASLDGDPLWKRSGIDVLAAKDVVFLTCHDGPLNSLVVFEAVRENRTLRPNERRILRRLATHIGTAFRLRRNHNSRPDRAAAVLSPSGRIEHLAAGEDGAAIEEGFTRRHLARRPGTATDSALEIWRGLHDGRWSLVDYVDTDHKSFVLAVRNEPARDIASTLTDRQRAVAALAALGYGNKQIAYALGLTAAAVAMLVTRARVRTGVRTRTELIRVFKQTLAGVPGTL